jgi:hypothetical protein
MKLLRTRLLKIEGQVKVNLPAVASMIRSY